MGYDLITFSGGKAMRGPQCAGLLIGRKGLVGYALLNNSLNEDTIGRSQKVGKEEIIGMVKALELYLKEDHDALTREWQARLAHLGELTEIPGVSTSFFTPDIANHVPHMQISWDSRVPAGVEAGFANAPKLQAFDRDRRRRRPSGLTSAHSCCSQEKTRSWPNNCPRATRALGVVRSLQVNHAIGEHKSRTLVSGLLAVCPECGLLSRPGQHLHCKRINR